MNTPEPIPAAAPAPVTVGAVVWYKSPQYLLAMTLVLGGALSFFPKLRAALTAANVSILDFVEMVGAGITLIGGGIVWLLRQISKIQPVTLTAKGAATHPSTIAVIETQAAMRDANIPTAVERQAQIQSSSSKSLSEKTS